MKFLSKFECEELISRVGIDPRTVAGRARIRGMKHTGRFVLPDRFQHLGQMAGDLVRDVGVFSWALFWPYGLPFGDLSRRENPPEVGRRYARWRAAAGERRALFDAPGHLFEPGEADLLPEAVEYGIGLWWDVILVARPVRQVIKIHEGALIEVQSRHNPSSISASLIRLGLHPLES